MPVRKLVYASLDLVFLIWSFWRILPCCASPVEGRSSPDTWNRELLFHYKFPESISKDGKSIELAEINSPKPGRVKGDNALQEDSWIQVHNSDIYDIGHLEQQNSEDAPEILESIPNSTDPDNHGHSSILALLKRSIGASEKDGNSVAIILIGSAAAVVSLVALTSCCFYVDKKQRPIGVYRMPTILVPDDGHDEDIPLESLSYKGHSKANMESPVKENTTQSDSTSSDSSYGSRTLFYYQSSHGDYSP